MPMYMQFRTDGLAIGYSQLGAPVESDSLGEVADEAEARERLGMIHSDGEWSAFVEPAPEPIPTPLDEAALIDLCQSAGGMTDAMLVAVYADPQLAAFVIKLRAARAILPTDERTTQGLAALEALGYLPNGAEAVIAAWPAA